LRFFRRDAERYDPVCEPAVGYNTPRNGGENHAILRVGRDTFERQCKVAPNVVPTVPRGNRVSKVDAFTSTFLILLFLFAFNKELV
jgi:hypothetical protein